jgi:DNA (cytosine-5)-methyltransferase 1
MSRPPVFVDFFAGAGGLSLGLAQAGLLPVFACDSIEVACVTHRANLGDHVQIADMTKLTRHDVLEQTGLRVGEIDVVAGGPPCQGFSTQRRGSRTDDRNGLVLNFAQIAIALRPKMILIENVPGLLGARGHGITSSLFALLEGQGFKHDSMVLNAADFGVPQNRRRTIIVAWDPSRAKAFRFPTPTHAHKPTTVRDALAGLPPPLADFTEHPQYHNHLRVKMSERNIERIRFVPEGGGRLDIPEELQLNCHRGAAHRHLDVFGRMRWDEPGPTITAMFDNFTRGRFAHPSEDRSITGREGARLQSFPDWFKFKGPKKDVARQIGNAVPPQLAEALGRELIHACAP